MSSQSLNHAQAEAPRPRPHPLRQVHLVVAHHRVPVQAAPLRRQDLGLVPLVPQVVPALGLGLAQPLKVMLEMMEPTMAKMELVEAPIRRAHARVRERRVRHLGLQHRRVR